MEHLGVELDSPDPSRPPRSGGGSTGVLCPQALPSFGGGGGGCKCRIFHIVGRTDHLEAFGDGGDGVTMTHPDLGTSIESLEERIV